MDVVQNAQNTPALNLIAAIQRSGWVPAIDAEVDKDFNYWGGMLVSMETVKGQIDCRFKIMFYILAFHSSCKVLINGSDASTWQEFINYLNRPDVQEDAHFQDQLNNAGQSTSASE